MLSQFNKIDLSSCTLEEIKTDLSSLKGMKVNIYQAAQMAKLLGIEIAE